MASVVKFWLERKKRNTQALYPDFYDSCIFQQVWRESCPEWKRKNWSFRMLHLSQLTRLLLDCLLTHRFHTALHCLTALCGISKRAPELLWRTGSEVLKQIPGSHTQTVQFYKSMFSLCRRYREEMLLEFAFYLITAKGELTEAYELVNSRYGQTPYSSNRLITLYLGLFEYTHWKVKNVKFSKTAGSHDMLDEAHGLHLFSNESTFNENVRRQVDFHGKRALAYFAGLTEGSGVLDIFVTRHVELLSYYDRRDEARQILKSYRDNNPDNPNAHRYLYHFLKSIGADKVELCSVLATLLEVDPTSELANEFTKLKMSSADHSVVEILQALFNKLDHSACKDDADTWKTLANTLTTIHEQCDPEQMDVLKGCWDTRSDWWPPYHFCAARLPSGEIQEHSVLRYKADVAAGLMGRENAFTTEVRGRLSGGTLPDRLPDNQQVLGDRTHRRRKRRATDSSSLTPFGCPDPHRSKMDSV